LKNRTGMQRSPGESRELLAGPADFQPDVPLPDPDSDGLAETRAEYIAEGHPLGTIPAPITPVGMVKSAAKMLAGDRVQVLVDKLAERLAFERSGTRLYDALIVKYDASFAQGGAYANESDDVRATTLGAPVTREVLLEIRNEEAAHYALVAEAIEQLGADPTAQTPCADAVGVQSLGLVQVLTDPRTSLPQSLNAILTAELADNAGWELLIQLAETLGQDDLIEDFRGALANEVRHLEVIRSWLAALVLTESGNPGAAAA
jgi:rubrerythrin